MKCNKFQATTYKCSGCEYRSLIKANVQNHLRSTCEGTKVVSEERVVAHYDEHDDDAIKATLYQCSKCDYTTPHATNMKTHTTKSACKGAKVLSSKRILTFEDLPKPSGGINTATNQSVINSNVAQSYNTTILNLIIPGTVEEKIAIIEAIAHLTDIGKLQVVLQDGNDMSTLPATLSKMTKEFNPRLDNKCIINNDVVSRVDGTKLL